MKKFAIILFAVVFIHSNLLAQQLYMPRNVTQAYKTGTRSADGKPGKNYWQNSGNYNIKIAVNPETRVVSGTEEIVYKNNSPEPLVNPIIRLTMNIHRPGIGREGSVSDDYLSTGITIDEFRENGAIKAWKPGIETLQGFKLTKKLSQGETVKLSFTWHYTLSKESGREGATEPTSFFIAYFYPRVAVFDDIDGWDTTPFTEGHEFYHDFNNYVLEVTAPKDYIVWSTGDLQNPDEVLQPKFAARLKESYTSDKVINIASISEIKSKTVTVQKDLLTWKWKADNITDVACAVSNNYIWDAGSVVVDKKTGRRASVQAAYNVEAEDYREMVGFVKHALDWCSNNYPGVPYPFSKSTAFRGVADMEYPMMINDSSFPNPMFSKFVAEHEVLHSWFPFYMGINEQRYGFMDEGWTTAFENLIGKEDLGEETATKLFQQFRVGGWALDSSSSSDLPIITPGDQLSGAALGHNQYGKAALAYLALKDLLGDAEFKRCLHEFMNRWNGKHPLPWDMFNSFNDASGKNLNWFFQNWFFSHNYIDVSIENVAKTDKGLTVNLKNIGGFAVPVTFAVTYEDGKTENISKSPEIWSKNQRSTAIEIPTSKKVKSVKIENGIYMDADESNDGWMMK
jgi:Peptidase family M1 domain